MPNFNVIVCDDIRLEASSKLILIGVYTGEIVIFSDNHRVPQLNFLFSVDIPVEKIPKKMEFEVSLPGGGASQRSGIEISVPNIPEGNTRWIWRQIIGFVDVFLEPGRIEARVVIDDTEYPVAATWIRKSPDISDSGTDGFHA